jgi:hypothetical protein
MRLWSYPIRRDPVLPATPLLSHKIACTVPRRSEYRRDPVRSATPAATQAVAGLKPPLWPPRQP